MRIIIRAATLHLGLHKWSREELEKALSLIQKFRYYAKELAKELGIELWTIRISTPKIPRSININKFIDFLDREIPRDVLIATGHMDEDDDRIFNTYTNILCDYDRIYSSINIHSLKGIDVYLSTIKKLSESCLEASTKLAAIMGNPIITPYFPASITSAYINGISIALRYVRDLKYSKWYIDDDSIINVFSKAEAYGKTLANKLGIKFLGIDPSLSPWIDESVGRVIEEVSGDQIPSLSTLYAIRLVNEAIARASNRVTATGFAEIMMPVAEDVLLIRRAIEGKLSLTYLVSAIAQCVAGIDMVALSSEALAKQAVIAVLALSRAKAKAQAARIVLATNYRIGDVIKLRGLEIPVLAL